LAKQKQLGFGKLNFFPIVNILIWVWFPVKLTQIRNDWKEALFTCFFHTIPDGSSGSSFFGLPLAKHSVS
jgi:hypothetical protein